MRGAARLGISVADATLVKETGQAMHCVICGAPTTTVGLKVVSGVVTDKSAPLGGIWDRSFTDRDKVLTPLGDGGRGMCQWCATAARDWMNAPSGTLTPVRANKRGQVYLFADGKVELLHNGLTGLRDLVALADRTEPFALLAGAWQQKAYHWAWAPVAWPSQVFPALWASPTGPFNVWLDTQAIKKVADEAEEAGAESSESGVVPPDGYKNKWAFLVNLNSLGAIQEEGGRHIVLSMLLGATITKL